MARSLRSLTTGDGVLDGVRVQGQLVRKLEQGVMIGVAQVEPYESPLLLQMVRDVLDRKVLDLEAAVTPELVRTPFLMPVVTDPVCAAGQSKTAPASRDVAQVSSPTQE
jgi:hypothetical protein